MTTHRAGVTSGGSLGIHIIPAPKPKGALVLRTPFGRIILSRDRGEAFLLGKDQFVSNLRAVHRSGNGKIKDIYDLGSGLVTNCGVDMMANDAAWVAAATPFSTLSTLLYQSTGTGTTAAAAADFFLQTPGANFSGGTNKFFTGVGSVVAPNIYQCVATVNYSGAEAVTEWGIFTSNAAAIAATETGTPTATTFPDSGAAFATAGNGLKGRTILINATAVNTPTTKVMGLITANTATGLTIANGWWTLANASATTPSATSPYIIEPTMVDHKVFSALNVANLDGLAFTYQLTMASGG